jgi:hypothetical protein
MPNTRSIPSITTHHFITKAPKIAQIIAPNIKIFISGSREFSNHKRIEVSRVAVILYVLPNFILLCKSSTTSSNSNPVVNQGLVGLVGHPPY